MKMHQWIKMAGVVMCGMVLSWGMTARASVFYQNNFESGTQGLPAAGWSFSGTSGSANVLVAAPPSPVPANGLNTLNHFDNDATAVPFGGVTFAPAVPTDFDVAFSFDFNYQPTASTVNTLVALVDGTTSGLLLQLAASPAGGSIGIWNRSLGPIPTVSFTPGQWYHAATTLGPVGGTGHQVTLTVTSLSGGPDPGSIAWTYEPITTGFNRIYMQENAGVGMVDNSLFLDNFEVSGANPEPSTVLLLGVGGLIAWRRRK